MLLKLSSNNILVVSIKKNSNYATFSSNNWVKLRWQPKLLMELNGLSQIVGSGVTFCQSIRKCFNDPSNMLLECLLQEKRSLIIRKSPWLKSIIWGFNITWKLVLAPLLEWSCDELLHPTPWASLKGTTLKGLCLSIGGTLGPLLMTELELELNFR